MNRRIILIIGSAVLLALLVGLVWFFFFRATGLPPTNTGTFGTGGDRTGQGTGNGNNTGGNVPSNVIGSGNNAGSGTAGAGVSGPGGISGGSIPSSSVSGPSGFDAVPGVDWLGGTNPTGGASTNFVPRNINQLNDGSVGGTPGIVGTNLPGQGGDNGNGFDLGLAGLFGAGAGCALYATFQAGGEAKAGAEGGAALGGGFVLVYDWRANAKQSGGQFKDIGDCLARTIGKAVIQQMTNSIVNWINSGFNGQPSFVTNYQQFFSNVGDQAAGEFIRGTSLSFLCSPFQAQIRVAIAQSYARRNAGSCSLSGIVKNITGFMNGNFSQGGWGGLLSFTSVPTNNPFGAYAYAQAGLYTAQQSAVANASRNISPGGFISVQKCDPPGSKNCKVVTPGAVIEDSLKTTLQQPFLANQLAKSFDEIINALLNQLMTKTLYQGLSSLSGTQGYAADYLTPAEQQAQQTAQGLLVDMQSKMRTAQQYGSVWQSAIADIQKAQQRLNDLANCYSYKGNTAQASSTQEVMAAYDTQIDLYNDRITAANEAIALLQDLQTRTISVVTPADVAAVQAAYQSALATGKVPTDADVTTAQQDRASLQSNLNDRNAATAAALAQCNAL